MAKISYGHCCVSVLGMDMNCPLCGTLVKSGERHECVREEPKPVKKIRKRKKLISGYGTPKALPEAEMVEKEND